MIDANAPHSATPKMLDPYPYLGWDIFCYGWRRSATPRAEYEFRPGSGYSQNIEDY